MRLSLVVLASVVALLLVGAVSAQWSDYEAEIERFEQMQAGRDVESRYPVIPTIAELQSELNNARTYLATLNDMHTQLLAGKPIRFGLEQGAKQPTLNEIEQETRHVQMYVRFLLSTMQKIQQGELVPGSQLPVEQEQQQQEQHPIRSVQPSRGHVQPRTQIQPIVRERLSESQQAVRTLPSERYPAFMAQQTLYRPVRVTDPRDCASVTNRDSCFVNQPICRWNGFSCSAAAGPLPPNGGSGTFCSTLNSSECIASNRCLFTFSGRCVPI